MPIMLRRLSPGSVQFYTRRSNAVIGAVTSNSVKQIASPCRSVLPAHRSAATTRVTSIQLPPLKERSRHSSTRPHDRPQFLCAVCVSVNIRVRLLSIIYRHFFVARPCTVDEMKVNVYGALMESKLP